MPLPIGASSSFNLILYAYAHDDVGQRGRQVKATGPFRNRQHADTAANEDMRVIHITDKVHRTTPLASCLDVPIAITSYDLHSVAVWIPSWGLSSLVWH
jgi:hypothetical protein